MLIKRGFICILRQAAVLDRQQTGKQETKVRENDWKSFAILSMPIFARSVGFTLSNTFIPIYWMTVLHASATQGTTALSILFTIGACITFGGGLLADRLGYVKVIRAAFFCMVPTYLFLTHTTDIWVATALLVPAAVSIFMPYSPIVVLGQTYGGGVDLYALQSHRCAGADVSGQKCRFCFRRYAGPDHNAGGNLCTSRWRGGRPVGAGTGVADFLDCRVDRVNCGLFPSGTGKGIKGRLKVKEFCEQQHFISVKKRGNKNGSNST